MLSKNTTHLAGEFLVAGELARRGYDVSITFGNAKSVDIYAGTKEGVKKVDAKAGRGKTNWPTQGKEHIKEDVYYVFVYLGSPREINQNVSAEYFVVLGKDLKDKVVSWAGGTRHGVLYKSVRNYKDGWTKLGTPPSATE